MLAENLVFPRRKTMTRVIPLVVVLLALPLPGWSKEKPVPTETVIRLKVQAAPAPKPALKYQLLPELREMNPGNPIQGYLKCFAEQNPFFHGKQALTERENWETMPLKDLPVKAMRGYGGHALRQADYAARLDNPDWQILLKLKSDGIYLLLPEVQQMRGLAWALKVRFRGEVADRRFEDALVTAKTMFALARHLGEHPTVIGDLIGIAIASIAIEPLEEMLQQPGCPNLFWALTDLPQPFIDLRRGLQGERVILAKEFSVLNEKEQMTAAQLQKVFDRFNTFLADSKLKGPKLGEWFAERAKDVVHVQAARKRLVNYGLGEDKIKQFPALQAVLLDAKFTFEVERDEATKGMMLPYWQAEPLLGVARGKEEPPFLWSISAGSKMRGAQARLDHRFALLRCVEALRIHAAENDGKLPVQLADVKLPLPVDPYTGKAFLYKLDGPTATLRGTAPPGLEKNPAFNIRYEIAIVK
jgi:hypothetical protein